MEILPESDKSKNLLKCNLFFSKYFSTKSVFMSLSKLGIIFPTQFSGMGNPNSVDIVGAISICNAMEFSGHLKK